MITCARPALSEVTTWDCVVLLVAVWVMPYGPEITSKRTWRPGAGPPPGTVTVTAAVPSWPEQIALAPHSVRFGVMVSALSSGAGRTVTLAAAVLDCESCTVIATVVSAATLAPNSGITLPATDCVTGSTAELLVNARYGGVPPLTSNVDGTPENRMEVPGSTVSAGGGVTPSALTCTVTGLVWPAESWIVIVTSVSTVTALAFSTTELPGPLRPTGSTPGLLE